MSGSDTAGSDGWSQRIRSARLVGFARSHQAIAGEHRCPTRRGPLTRRSSELAQPVAVRSSLLKHPPMQPPLCFIALVVWKPAVGLLKLQDFSQFLAPLARRALRSPSSKCGFVFGVDTWLVSFPCLKKSVDGGDVLVAAVGDFALGQPRCVHHGLFEMP